MLKTLIFAVGAAAAAATAAKALSYNTKNKKKGARMIVPEESRKAVVAVYDEPAAKEYEMDYIFV